MLKKTWMFDNEFWRGTWKRVQTYSTELPLDYHLPRHEPNSDNNLFKMDPQLWLLRTSNNLSTGSAKHFSTNKLRWSSSSA